MPTDFSFSSRFAFNAVIVLDALRAADSQTGIGTYNALRDLQYEHPGVHCERIVVDTASDMLAALSLICDRTRRNGLLPILHIECHGDKSGLEIGEGRERLSWTMLERYLRPINIATQCNLGVVMAVCDGLRAITPIDIKRPTPFYFLIGVDAPVSQGTLQAELPAFYRTLIETNDLHASLDRAASFKTYHAERLFAGVLARVFQESRGKRRQSNVERLVTSVRTHGGLLNRATLRRLRAAAKQNVKQRMSPLTFDRYAKKFLMGREPAFTYHELARWVTSTS